MQFERLITVADLSHAYLLKGKLNNEGIECFLTHQNITNLLPHYTNMLGGGVQIHVKEIDLATARELIRDELEPENNVTICPFCGSHHVKLGPGEKKGLKIFNMLLAIVAALPLGHLKPKYYCQDCKKEIK